MKIDIRNIFSEKGNSKAVDVKHVLESDAEEHVEIEKIQPTEAHEIKEATEDKVPEPNECSDTDEALAKEINEETENGKEYSDKAIEEKQAEATETEAMEAGAMEAEIPSSIEAEKDQEAKITENEELDEAFDSCEEVQPEEIDETPSFGKDCEQQPALRTKERLLRWGSKYGWLTGICVAFVALLAGLIVYTTMIPRDVHAIINGEEFTFTTTEYTVENFLRDEKIEFCQKDYLSVVPTAYIYDGMKITIKHATDFKVTADGKTRRYKTLKNTVGTALRDVGIKVGKSDIVNPAPETFLKSGMVVVVQRVDIKKKTVEESVPFKTVNRDDPSMREGTTKVITEGTDGKDKVTYEIKYLDGVEQSRTEVARETITAVVDKIVANGTMIDYNGKTYSRKLTVKAYSYTGGGTTAMGTRARVGEIAVDPRVIPLGTNVYIEGVGARRAEDTGGNIKGNTIDIYMNSQAECIRWGVRYVTIYIE